MIIRKPGQVLVVDDSKTKAHALKRMLLGEGYQVEAVNSAAAALQVLEQGSPDLILLDVVMPSMDGFELCEQLKSDERTQGIPVIFITTLTDTESKLRGFAVGGEDYIQEPFIEAEVLARVGVTLRHRQAEQALRLKTRELEDYTYVVSHDLKEPLHAISGFSGILIEDYQDKLDDAAKRHLNRIVKACRRMKNMIDDLLTLSRLGRRDALFSPLDLNELVEDIKLDLAELIKRKNGTIEPCDLPRVVCQHTWITELFRNLIGNGLKYNTSEEPRVSLSYQERETEWEFAIADNGIGIEKEYQEKIFGLFTRLHSREAYEGTGAGLTIARSIVQRHDGKIWIGQSVLGKKTVFKFTISKLLD